MKALILYMSLFLYACTIPVGNNKTDELTEIINAHKSGDLKNFLGIFGPPASIQSTDDKDNLIYVYPHFETLVNPTKNVIITTSTFFWKSDDDYAYLKKKFGQYHWIEKSIPTSTHAISEVYSVEIPEIGVSFEYDRYAPKVTWIFISKPVTK
jgi:hypothetical protein